MATPNANSDDGKGNSNEDSESNPLETPVMKKRRVLKLVPKRKKTDLNLSASATKKKKFYQAFTQNMNLNASMQKQTLIANNRALAYKLEQTRQEVRMLNEVTIELRRENQELHVKNTKLEAVAGLRNEEVEKEVDKRMVERLNTLKANLGKMGQFLYDATTLLSECMDECALASRRSTCSSRGRSYGSTSDWSTPPVEINGGYRRSLYDLVPKTALPEVDNINGKVGSSVYSLASHDMSVIAEQSVLLENITPPLDMNGGSPILEENSAEKGEKSKKDATDIFVNCKPRRVLCKTSDADLDLNDLQKNVTNNKTSGMENTTKDIELGSIDDGNTASKTNSDRRGTFVVPPEDAMKLPVFRQTSDTSTNSDSSFQQSASDSELSGPSKPSKIPKKTCSESDKNKVGVSEPTTVNTTSNEDRRKTFIVPLQPDSTAVKNSYFNPAIVDDEVTTYFNADMEFTEVIDESQLISMESFRSKFMSNNSPQKEGISKSGCKTNTDFAPKTGTDSLLGDTHKMDTCSLSGKTHKRSKERQPENKAAAKNTTKSSSDSKADPEKTKPITDSQSAKSIFEFRLPKPGKIVFSATRKEVDGTRKPVPSKLPSKTRSKSKVKLSRPVSKSNSAQESPKQIQSIFDFHDKTPRMTSENASRIVSSVYDLSMNESAADPGTKASLSQFRELSNTNKGSQVVDKNDKVLQSNNKELDTDTKSKPRTKSKKTNGEKLAEVETKNLSEVNPDKTSRTKSQVSAGQNSRDEQNKSPEAKPNTPTTADPKEIESRLLGDKPVYYLPLKDCSPDVNVTKGRSRSRGRKSQKSDAEDDQQDQKSRSRSRSRRRRADSDTENEVESRRSRGRSRTRKTDGENTVDECNRSKSRESSEKQKQDDVTDHNNDHPIHINTSRGRSRSRASTKQPKLYDPDSEEEPGQRNSVESNELVISKEGDRGNENKEIKRKSRSLDGSLSEENEDKGKKTIEDARKSKGRSRSRAPVKHIATEDSDEEEKNVEPEKLERKSRGRSRSQSSRKNIATEGSNEEQKVESENKPDKLERKSRGRSRSRASRKNIATEDSDEEEKNVESEKLEGKSRGHSRSRASRKNIATADSDEEEKNVEPETLQRKSRGRSRSRASMKKIATEDSDEEQKVESENIPDKLERKSRGRSRSRASRKNIATEDSDEEQKVESENIPDKLERKLRGRSHSRVSTKKIVIDDSDEEEKNVEPEKLERKSRGRSRSRASTKKIVIDDSDEEEKNIEPEKLERKSRGRSRSRASMKKIVIEDSDEEEQKVESKNKLEKLDRKSRGRSPSRASMKNLIIEDSDVEEKNVESENILEKLERNSRGVPHSRASTKKIVSEDSDEEENKEILENKLEKLERKSRGRSCSRASTKVIAIEDSDEKERNIEVEKKLEKLERKSRGRSCSRASIKNKDGDDDKEENIDREILEMGRKSSSSVGQISDKIFVVENNDKAETDKELENRTSKTPAKDSVKKSHKRHMSAKKVHLQDKENTEDQSEIQKELSVKRSAVEYKGPPGILDSVENKSQNAGSVINLQNVRKRLAALESMRSTSTDILSTDSQERGEPDAKRPRRREVISYKEPSLMKKMRQPVDTSSRQDSRSKKRPKLEH